MTYTGTYTAPFCVTTYTDPGDLHGHPVRMRVCTYTDTYTTYTRRDLHDPTPLCKRGSDGVPRSRARLTATKNRRKVLSSGRTGGSPLLLPARHCPSATPRKW